MGPGIPSEAAGTAVGPCRRIHVLQVLSLVLGDVGTTETADVGMLLDGSSQGRRPAAVQTRNEDQALGITVDPHQARPAQPGPDSASQQDDRGRRIVDQVAVGQPARLLDEPHHPLDAQALGPPRRATRVT